MKLVKHIKYLLLFFNNLMIQISKTSQIYLNHDTMANERRKFEEIFDIQLINFRRELQPCYT